MSDLQIVDYQPAHGEVLCEIYEATTSDCAHCHPVDRDLFARTLGGEMDSVLGERVFVAIRDGSPLGFSHAVIRNPKNLEGNCGAIRFLSYNRGDRGTGIELLRTTLDYFREEKVVAIRAFDHNDQYPFYHRNHAYLSDRIGHVQALLTCEGFRRGGGEVHLDWDDFELEDPFEIEQEVDLTWKTEESAGPIPSFNGRCTSGETLIGETRVISAANCHPSQGDRLFVNWLGVEEAFQRKGYGRYILQEAMREGKRMGYRHAGISTAFNNYRAYAFYTNCGFRVTDWTYGWELAV